jgi:hypothetical protein
MPKKKEAESGEKPVKIEPKAEMVEVEEPSSVETTEEDPSLQQEKDAKPMTKREEWIAKTKKIEDGKISKAEETQIDNQEEWIKKAKKFAREEEIKAEIEAKRIASAEQGSTIENIELKVSEQYPNSYRVTDWSGQKNYECNKCAYASLDKFKLYTHLIQEHSGIEYDYRGETTHS